MFDIFLCLTCLSPPPGRSSLFPIDDNLLDDGHGNQGVPGVLGSPNCYPHQNGERIERFSRKVFVGGLPPDIDEGEKTTLTQSCILEHYPTPFMFVLFDLICLSSHFCCSFSPPYIRWNNLKLPPLWSPGGRLAPQGWKQILLSSKRYAVKNIHLCLL